VDKIREFGAAVTIREAADLLGIEYGTIKAYVMRKQIPAEYLRRSGNTWLISIKYLEQKLRSI